MALTHKVSDVLHIRRDFDDKQHPVVEMEFKFIRYRLTVDDVSKAKELVAVFNEIIDEDVAPKKEKLSLPKFYRDTK